MNKVKATTEKVLRTTLGKALNINQNPALYGTFAEIGAGQEVARHFFQAGQASQTIAKTISAYDMIYSDEIYGKEASGRYVCESRLNKMLDKEFKLLQKRLDPSRGARTQFFAYANTVTTGDQTRRYCHGWMGVRFQTTPKGEPNDIVMHVRMLDRYRLQQQEALGMLGVNLVSAAFNSSANAEDLVPALMENLRAGQVAIDLIRCSGPDLAHLNNHLLNLELCRRNLTEAVLFGPDGSIQPVSDTLYSKPLIIDRGEFRPVTKMHLHLIERGQIQYKQDFPKGDEPLVLFELTMQNLMKEGSINEQDFLDRVQTLCVLGHHVLVSNFYLFYRLKRYLRTMTKAPITLLIRAINLRILFDETQYADLEGGLLEAMGKLLDKDTRIYAFPQLENDQCLMVDHFEPEGRLKLIFQYFRQQNLISDLGDCNDLGLLVHSDQIRGMIKKNDPKWEQAIPPAAVKVIKEKKLFGFGD